MQKLLKAQIVSVCVLVQRWDKIYIYWEKGSHAVMEENYTLRTVWRCQSMERVSTYVWGWMVQLSALVVWPTSVNNSQYWPFIFLFLYCFKMLLSIAPFDNIYTTCFILYMVHKIKSLGLSYLLKIYFFIEYKMSKCIIWFKR